jgi:hypothetical protein
LGSFSENEKEVVVVSTGGCCACLRKARLSRRKHDIPALLDGKLCTSVQKYFFLTTLLGFITQQVLKLPIEITKNSDVLERNDKRHRHLRA